MWAEVLARSLWKSRHFFSSPWNLILLMCLRRIFNYGWSRKLSCFSPSPSIACAARDREHSGKWKPFSTPFHPLLERENMKVLSLETSLIHSGLENSTFMEEISLHSRILRTIWEAAGFPMYILPRSMTLNHSRLLQETGVMGDICISALLRKAVLEKIETLPINAEKNNNIVPKENLESTSHTE